MLSILFCVLLLKDGIDNAGLWRLFITNIIKDLNDNFVILRGQYGAKHLNYDIGAFGENYYVQLALLIGFLCVHTISPISIFNKKYLKYLILN